MWHNDEIMTNWKDSVMSKEEFEKKEADRIIDEALMEQVDYSQEWIAFMADYSSTRDEEPIIVKEGDRAKNLVLLYKIEKKLHKMGFTYDEQLIVITGLEENIRVYTEVEYAPVFTRMRNCYVTELSEDNTVSLHRKLEGRETEIDVDEFLRGEE